MPQIKNNSSKEFRHSILLGLVMFYMMFSMLSGIMIHKIIHVSLFAFPIGVFINPLTYAISNVVTETYGYPVSRCLMWWSIIVSSIFATVSFFLSFIPSSIPELDYFYARTFGFMPLIFIAGTVGTICGLSINNYIVSKLKISFNGKTYWLRTLMSVWPGELVYNIVAYPIMYFLKYSCTEIITLILSVTLVKFFMTLFFLYPECLLVRHIKEKEKINTFDYDISYNIFVFSTNMKKNEKPELKLIHSI
jgi:uncharacterized integral membrane protein (TIGR00697 family)